MKEIAYIFVGGGLGSVLRYVTSGWISSYSVSTFPMGTFMVNLAGCFLIGLFYSFSARWNFPPGARLLLTGGLCGGFTTFSTFGRESLLLLRQSHYTTFGLYLTLSVLLGMGCVFVGAWAGNVSLQTQHD